MNIYRSFSVILVILSAVIIASCSKTVTYTDMLKREERAIQQLIDENGFEILKDFPKDWQFKDNQFVELPNGVYINIVDSGNGVRATATKTVVYARFTADYIMKDSAVATFKTLSNYGVSSGVTDPVEFRYGTLKPVVQTPSSALQVQLELLLSEGMQTGLQYVGHGGKVKLIVPFKVGSSQKSKDKTTSDQAAGQPVFFEILQYRFADEL